MRVSLQLLAFPVAPMLALQSACATPHFEFVESQAGAAGWNGMPLECSDDTLSGDESDTDCGGSCKACGETSACRTHKDCASLVCSNGRCAASSCSDQIQNPNETDVDCGGGCLTCSLFKSCKQNSDCASDLCSNGSCDARLFAAQQSMNVEESTQQIHAALHVHSESPAALGLSRIKMRYYLTSKDEVVTTPQLQILSVTTSGPSGSRNFATKTQLQFRSVASALPNADSYFEVAFPTAAGALATGDHLIAEFQATISGAERFTQSNDYSFDPSATPDTASKKISLYVDDRLVWGTEPK